MIRKGSLTWGNQKPAVGTKLRDKATGGLLEVVEDHGHLISLNHLDGPHQGPPFYRIGPDVFHLYEEVVA